MQRKRTRRAWSSMRQSGVSTCGRQQESNKTHQSYGRMQAATDQKEGKRNSGGNLDAIGTVASYSLGATSLCSCCNRNWQEFLCRKNSKMIIFFLDRAKMTNIQRSDGIRRAVISRGVRGLSDCLDLKFSMRSVPSSSIWNGLSLSNNATEMFSGRWI
jgi:hypothetical protein